MEPGERQRFELTVASNQAIIAGRRTLVLDREPFSVVEVTTPALMPLETDGTLARFESDFTEGAMWAIRIRDTSVAIREPEDPKQRGDSTFRLPPQAVGESMIKRTDDGGAQDGLLDFRLSPPAVLRLYTTWRSFERSTVEPPHNLRRIFGDASQRAPGREPNLEPACGSSGPA